MAFLIIWSKFLTQLSQSLRFPEVFRNINQLRSEGHFRAKFNFVVGVSLGLGESKGK